MIRRKNKLPISYNKKRALLSRAIVRGGKIAFRDILIHFGVGGLAASVASHFVFRYIFKPMVHHFIKKHAIRHIELADGRNKIVIHNNDGHENMPHYKFITDGGWRD